MFGQYLDNILTIIGQYFNDIGNTLDYNLNHIFLEYFDNVCIVVCMSPVDSILI